MDPSDAVVTRWLAAGDAGDLDAFDDLLDPEVVVHAPAGLSSRGVEAEKGVWRAAKSAVPDLEHHVQEVLVGDGVEMARVVVTGTLHSDFAGLEASGQHLSIDQAVIVHVRDGRIVEAWEIANLGAVTA